MYQHDNDLGDTIAAIELTLNRLEQERDAAKARGIELDEKCDVLASAVACLRQEVSVDGNDAITRIDFTGCRNMGDRLDLIAQALGGTVDVDQALDMLERWWSSGAKRDTRRKDINSWINEHPDDWEKVRTRVYRYLRYKEGEGETKTEEH